MRSILLKFWLKVNASFHEISADEVSELHIKVSYEAQFSTTLKVKKYFAENMCENVLMLMQSNCKVLT